MSLRTELFQAGSLAILVRILSVLAGLLSSVVLARFLGPSEYGLYAFIFAVISILALPAQMGLPLLVVRETARAVTEHDWPKLRGIWGWSAVVTICSSAVVIAIALIGFSYLSLESHSQYSPFFWGLALVPLLGFSAIIGAANRGLKYIFLAQCPDQVLRPVLFAISAAIVFSLYPESATAKTALTLLFVTLAITFCMGGYLLFRVQPQGARQCKTAKMNHRIWFRSIVPLSLVSGLQLISQNTDLLMLGLLRPSEEVGLYKIALSVSTLTILGLTAFNLVIQPYVVEFHKNKELVKLQRIISAGAGAAVAFTVPVVAVFIFFGRELISLFYGAAFADANIALIVLSLGSISTAYFGAAGVLLTMAGLEKSLVGLLSISTLSNVALNSLFIPPFGILGAATATALSTIFLNILLWRAARAQTSVNCSPVFIAGEVVSVARDKIRNLATRNPGGL